MLEKRVLGQQLTKTLHGEEMIVKTVLLLASRRTGGAGYGIFKIGILLQKHIDQSGLSAP
jgi:hypothetical protein